MTIATKAGLIAFLGLFTGATMGLWSAFGGEVYLAYLGDMVMRCF
ncbi:MAG: hypothetical protein AAGF28_06620 [Pseudomonadota bacterium]